jgi:hypothetical protein
MAGRIAMARWRWISVSLLCLGVVFTACGDDTITDGGVPCTRNEECGVGEYCNDGVCTPYKTCSSDEECGAGEICKLGVCQPGTRPDGGDGDAGDGGDQLPDGGDPAADVPPPQPEITLAGDVIEIVDQQGTTYEINYGSVTMGTPVTRVLIIRNTGDADLEVSVINIDMDPNDEFRLEPTVPPALTIEPGGEEPLGVIYTPSDGLTDRAIAEIFSNDPVNGQIPVQLISEFKGTAEIGLIPSTLDFGNVPVIRDHQQRHRQRGPAHRRRGPRREHRPRLQRGAGGPRLRRSGDSASLSEQRRDDPRRRDLHYSFAGQLRRGDQRYQR